MRNTLIAGVAAIALLVGGGLRAQDNEPTSATGCLQAGAAAGRYVLVLDDRVKYQVEAAEDVKLADHENHRVELTGALDKSAAEPVIKTTALKMVVASCEAAAQ
jgi:hypothetical protein